MRAGKRWQSWKLGNTVLHLGKRAGFAPDRQTCGALGLVLAPPPECSAIRRDFPVVVSPLPRTTTGYDLPTLQVGFHGKCPRSGGRLRSLPCVRVGMACALSSLGSNTRVCWAGDSYGNAADPTPESRWPTGAYLSLRRLRLPAIGPRPDRSAECGSSWRSRGTASWDWSWSTHVLRMNCRAKRLECVQRAGVVVGVGAGRKSGSKLPALQTLRAGGALSTTGKVVRWAGVGRSPCAPS
jgi:hypothetical protein